MAPSPIDRANVTLLMWNSRNARNNTTDRFEVSRHGSLSSTLSPSHPAKQRHVVVGAAMLNAAKIARPWTEAKGKK